MNFNSMKRCSSDNSLTKILFQAKCPHPVWIFKVGKMCSFSKIIKLKADDKCVGFAGNCAVAG